MYFKQLYLIILMFLVPSASLAESFDYLFEVRFGPAKIGEMRVLATNDGRSYSASTRLVTTGVVGALYDVRYEYSVAGRVGPNGKLLPVFYRYEGEEEGRQLKAQISFSGDRVSKVEFEPDRSIPSNATSQRGTVDPMSLIYMLLRPAKAKDVCTGAIEMFDGRNRSTVQFKNIRHLSNGNVECSVFYSSAGGGGLALSSLVFVPDGNGMVRVTEFEAHTNIGKLVATSR